jgi:hypothetical protein
MKKWGFLKIAQFSHFAHRRYGLFLYSNYDFFWKKIENLRDFENLGVKFYFYELKWNFLINKTVTPLRLREKKKWWKSIFEFKKSFFFFNFFSLHSKSSIRTTFFLQNLTKSDQYFEKKKLIFFNYENHQKNHLNK